MLVAKDDVLLSPPSQKASGIRVQDSCKREAKDQDRSKLQRSPEKTAEKLRSGFSLIRS